IVQETARPCGLENTDKRSSSRNPTTQEGSIIFMTTDSNLQLSSGHRHLSRYEYKIVQAHKLISDLLDDGAAN
ncbi:MAG: hypothetical protein K9K35_09885, partial [Rhodoferax sp.]|nr:hypothetical protein [Rhodoferax sp.]